VLYTAWAWQAESGAIKKEGGERGREEKRKPRARGPRKTEATELRRRGERSQVKMNSGIRRGMNGAKENVSTRRDEGGGNPKQNGGE
jgi:hypothetical protein